MAVIGSLIKGIIDITQSTESREKYIENQKTVLYDLLNKAKTTAFGKYFGFEHILDQDDIISTFQSLVPLYDYQRLHDEWLKQIHLGFSDITWPGRPSYFALTSGTTGDQSKRIPVSEEMLSTIRRSALKQISSLSNYDLPPEFFEREIMMLGSSTALTRRHDQLEEGEISGISASQIPFWFRRYYKPGKEISRIEDWDQRILQIAQQAPEWDIGALSGIPPWVKLMIKRILEFHKADHIHEIWPGLEVYTTGGVAFEPYKKSFESLFGKPVNIIDTYLASEGFLAFQRRPETSAMHLVTDNGVFFEFVPFDPQFIASDGSVVQDAPVKRFSEVEEGEEYILLISTVSGLWRYMIGDTILFTDIDRAEIKITGRTKFFMNVVGSQLSVIKLNEAIRALEKKLDTRLPEFVLAAIEINGEFYHKWWIGVEGGQNVSDSSLAEHLDEILKKANKNYRVARSKALKGVIVQTISPEIFNEWSAQNNKKGDQVKREKIMKEDRFQEFENFVNAQIQG